ncbi:cytoskeleton-associated protein 2 [Rhinophrynus dorsalis]
MASVLQPLPASRRQQPQYREQRRKKVEEYLSRKMSNLKLSEPDKLSEIRSPLSERANLLPVQSKTEITNPVEQKLINKENISAQSVKKRDGNLGLKNTYKKTVEITNVGKKKNPNSDVLVEADKRKGSQSRSLSHTFLKTKNIKEQLKDEKTKPNEIKDVPKKPSKPVLGTFHGKIVQSKINSFRKAPEITVDKKVNEGKESTVTVSKSAGVRSKTSDAVVKKQIPKSAPSGSVDQRRPSSSQSRPQVKPSKSAVVQNRAESVTTRRETQIFIQRKSMGGTLVHRPLPQQNSKNESVAKKADAFGKQKKPAAPVNTVSKLPQNKPAAQPTAKIKYSRPQETAEERKARLAEWRAAKGKVMKRPPLSAVMSSTYKVQKAEPERQCEPKEVIPEIKTEPEQPVQETRQLFWATMAEEDERELFTWKVHQMFGDCQKLIDEGCPKAEVLGILEKQIQTVPEAKTISKYWECLARLERREGELGKVIAICEEAVAAGAQPLDELRTILADALENLKTASSDSVKQEPELVQDLKTEIKSEDGQKELNGFPVKKKKKVRLGGVRKIEAKEEIETSDINEDMPNNPQTPENNDSSTVVKFSIQSTPRLQKMKTRMQMDESDPTFKDFKFLTPVRRSRRLERKSGCLPDMLKDHDPCVSGIAQLGDLESRSNAYIFRENHALKEVTAKIVHQSSHM